MPVAQQKRRVPLDTHFRGDSMNKNKLFGASVKTTPLLFEPGKQVGRA